MKINDLKDLVPDKLFTLIKSKNFSKLRPSQVKSIQAGLFDGSNLLVCTPTASGKTLVAELGMLNTVFSHNKKALYVVPLRALAKEKYKQFKNDFHGVRVGVSSGELDSVDVSLKNFDIIIVTSEKLDSLLRHHSPWIFDVGVVVFDEIHLLNDISRGPTLEVVITLLRSVISKLQIIGLSATIGNSGALADWLGANLVVDSWRPIKLHKGIYFDGRISYEN